MRNTVDRNSEISYILPVMQMLAASCKKQGFPGFVSLSVYVLFFNVKGHSVLRLKGAIGNYLTLGDYGNADYAIDNVEAVTL